VKSRVVKSGGEGWAAIRPQAYKDDAATFCEVTRRVLLGRMAGDDLAFEIRYFEVAPGGWTSLERHQHPHAVVVLVGSGEVRFRSERVPIAPFDAVYVAPGEAHQFLAAADEKLGLLCVVDHERDRPELVDESDLLA
jgi:quercetin dioxygenase-like cupin family protein